MHCYFFYTEACLLAVTVLFFFFRNGVQALYNSVSTGHFEEKKNGGPSKPC